jgi:hypothetical protein
MAVISFVNPLFSGITPIQKYGNSHIDLDEIIFCIKAADSRIGLMRRVSVVSECILIVPLIPIGIFINIAQMLVSIVVSIATIEESGRDVVRTVGNSVLFGVIDSLFLLVLLLQIFGCIVVSMFDPIAGLKILPDAPLAEDDFIKGVNMQNTINISFVCRSIYIRAGKMQKHCNHCINLNENISSIRASSTGVLAQRVTIVAKSIGMILLILIGTCISVLQMLMAVMIVVFVPKKKFIESIKDIWATVLFGLINSVLLGFLLMEVCACMVVSLFSPKRGLKLLPGGSREIFASTLDTASTCFAKPASACNDLESTVSNSPRQEEKTVFIVTGGGGVKCASQRTRPSLNASSSGQGMFSLPLSLQREDMGTISDTASVLSLSHGGAASTDYMGRESSDPEILFVIYKKKMSVADAQKALCAPPVDYKILKKLPPDISNQKDTSFG